MKRRIATLFALIFCLSTISLVGRDIAQAATYVVTSTANTGPGSLRDAVTQANANPGADTIELPAGTFDLSVGALISPVNAGDELVITGQGADQTILSGDSTGRLFEIQDGSITTFEGVTFQNGAVTGGGGGGAIRAVDVNELTIRDSIFADNTAAVGGALLVSGTPGVGEVLIVDTTFSNNSTNPAGSEPANGGAIAAFNVDLSIYTSTFTGNVTRDPVRSSNGGALYVEGGRGEVYQSTFTENLAEDGSGAAIFFIDAAGRINNSTVSNNTASAFGGGIASAGSAFVEITHATVALNVAAEGGAGLYALGGELVLNNTLIHDNFSVASSNCGVDQGVITSIGGNLSNDLTCTSLTQPTDLDNNSGTTLGALADNGGVTSTHALVAGSSAIDAITCIYQVDQRDVSRPQGPLCDIGAFELEEGLNTTTTTIDPTTTTIDPTTTTIDPTTTTIDPTTTTLGPTTTTTTTVDPTTTTSDPNSGATAAATTTTTFDGFAGVLPTTGSAPVGPLVLIAGLLVAFGAAMARAGRQRSITRR